MTTTAREQTAVTGDGSPLAGKRALVVEDEALTVLQITRVLERAGMTVVGAAMTGIEAVHLAQRDKPDVILMDINIPVMSGIDAAKRIMSLCPACVLMLTAYSSDEYRERAVDAGVCGYVTKPVSKDTLIPEIEAAFAEWQSRGDGAD